MKVRADNPDFIALAIYELGGIGEFIDVEDVFVRAFELAPDRFGWRTKGLPNYKSLSKALRDLEDSNPGYTIRTADGLARQLTVEGVEWVERELPRLRATTGGSGINPATRRPVQRRLNELREHRFVVAYLSGEEAEIDRYAGADILACSPDSPTEVWRERIESLRAAAREARRDDLLRFLDHLKSSRASWFGEDGVA